MKIFKIVKFLLENSTINSRTWVIRLRQISEMYDIEDPLLCLSRPPPSQSDYKEYILTKITAFHEQELRSAAVNNSRRTYLNVSLSNLRGHPHHAI